MESDNRNWKGSFIWRKKKKASASDGENEVVFFRKSFQCEEAASSLIVRVSADSRYRLYINGHSVLSGPCKGSGFIHYYETIDLSEYLVSGTNLLAVKVLHYPAAGENLSVLRSPLGMLILEADIADRKGVLIDQIVTDDSWLCLKDNSLSFISGQYNTMFLGGTEKFQAELYPAGWETAACDDSAWEHCMVYDLVDTTTGVLEPWQLTPRTIPLMKETDKTFSGVKYSSESAKSESLRQILLTSDSSTLTVEAGQSLVFEVDAGLLTTGFPVLALSGGKGGRIQMLCAECYENKPVEIPWERDKQVRDDAEKGSLYGDADCYHVSGRGSADNPEVYEPFWFRTFRFIRLEIKAAEERLEIRDLYYRQIVYPLNVTADFDCSDPDFRKLWDISLNTLQHCMHETYEDCPYYEQYQYTMDTYLQTLFTYNVSGDDRLARKAIYDFHSSLMPQGLLQSRFPSLESQIIPGFNIFWIMMLHDHYLNFGDVVLVKRYLATIDSVLSWFDRHLNNQGLVDNIPAVYWQFVDWVDEWRAGRGVPKAAESGPLTVYSLMYSAGLQKAAELNRAAGRSGMAAEYTSRSGAVLRSVLQECRDSETGLFRDGPGVRLFSQHCQIWAVLSGAVTGDEASTLMEKTLGSRHLAQTSYAMSFFLFRALEQAGLYDQVYSLWTPWKDMAKLNLTTWNEDPVTQRSDCHAWGAVPLYEFTAKILGVRPCDSESRAVTIQPHPGSLEWAKGRVVTQKGLIGISWRQREGAFTLEIDNPAGIELDICIPGGQIFSGIKDKRYIYRN